MSLANWGKSRRFGKYRIGALLATGGMAEIYLASQTGLAGFEKWVVIKRILPSLAKEKKFIDMFLDEARIAALLNHSNVVQIFDVGRIKGEYFIAMEYLSGESLSVVAKACQHHQVDFPEELAAWIALQVAEGLNYAHTLRDLFEKPLKIIHRDVSPQNIFVLYNGGVKLVDFGLAKATMSESRTQTGALKGKIAYMSPEQILGSDLDGRSDVFSLGVVLWECLTGRRCYQEETHLMLMESIVRQDIVSPREHRPELSEEISGIVLKAMSRDRSKRYQSAAEFRSALSSYLKSIPLLVDNAAIGNFMQKLFSKRMEEKQRLIEIASGTDSADPIGTIDDLSYCFSEQGALVSSQRKPSKVTVNLWTEKPSRVIANRRILLVMVLLMGSVLGLGIFWLVGKTKQLEEQEPIPTADLLTAPLPVEPHKRIPEPRINKSGDGLEVTRPVTPMEEQLTPAKEEQKPERKTEGRKKSTGKKKVNTGSSSTTAKSPATGILRFFTVPWVDVYFRGRKLGQTPLMDVPLPAGKVELKLVNQAAKIERTVVLNIKAGERLTKSLNLRTGTDYVPLP